MDKMIIENIFRKFNLETEQKRKKFQELYDNSIEMKQKEMNYIYKNDTKGVDDAKLESDFR
jgi:hypothetical protein